MKPFIDTHAHLYLEDFDDDRAAVVQRAREAGVSCAFLPNIDRSTFSRMWQMCCDYPDFCLPLTGVHPESVKENFQEELEAVHEQLLMMHERCIGIGEVGMDLYWETTYLEQQVEAFRQQVEWAVEFSLPLVIHCRRAFDSIYRVLREFDAENLRGIFHCFTADEGEMERMLEFPHFLLGINGISTFKKSPVPAALKQVPIERVAVETDAPYLAPVPKRGRRNESAYAVHTLSHLAEIYGCSADEMAVQTTKNVLRTFNLEQKCGGMIKFY